MYGVLSTTAGLARDRLAVYYIPGMGHGGAQFDAMIGPALDALEAWVDHRQSTGTVAGFGCGRTRRFKTSQSGAAFF